MSGRMPLPDPDAVGEHEHATAHRDGFAERDVVRLQAGSSRE